jgi:hypothetical protein
MYDLGKSFLKRIFTKIQPPVSFPSFDLDYYNVLQGENMPKNEYINSNQKSSCSKNHFFPMLDIPDSFGIFIET